MTTTRTSPPGRPSWRPEGAEADLLARFRLSQERRGVLESSIVARDRRLRALMGWMAPASVFAATREDLERYLDERNMTLSSRAGYLSHFHTFYAWAIDMDLAREDPTVRIPRPRRRRRLPRPIDSTQLVHAIECSTGDVRCFLLLAAYQGLRCQEIAGLCGEDVDRERGTLLVRAGKGDKERIVPLHQRVSMALPFEPRRGRLFRLTDGRPMKPHNVSHSINRHPDKIGIPATAHQLRHAFATELYKLTRDLRLTQELLGHSSPATTAIYAGFDPAGAAAVGRIEFGLPAP